MRYEEPKTCCNCKSENIHSSMKSLVLIDNNMVKEIKGRPGGIEGSGALVDAYHCENCEYVMIFADSM